MGPKQTKTKEIEKMICPICKRELPEGTSFKVFNQHLKVCAKDKITSNATADVYSPEEDSKYNNIILKRMENYINSKKSKVSDKTKIDFEIKKKN